MLHAFCIRGGIGFVTTLAIALLAAAVTSSAQPRASTNPVESLQLHAAIEYGDPELLRYLLDDGAVAPDALDVLERITPLQRCLRLAARVVDRKPSDRNIRRGPGGVSPSPVTRGRPTGTGVSFGIQTVDEMVRILHQYGARLTPSERSEFSAAVLNWYQGVISSSSPRRPPAASKTPNPGVPQPVPAQSPRQIPPDAIRVQLNRIFAPGVFQVTYRNTADGCVAFDPLVLGSDGVNIQPSSLSTLGAPINSITLQGDSEITVFFTLRVGTQTPVARNIRLC